MIVWAALAAAALGGMTTLWLAFDFWRDPCGAMERATHRPEFLPRVMVGRYAGFTLFAFGSALYGDLIVVLFLFVVFALISLFDAVLYKSSGLRYAPHALAAVGCLAVVALAGLGLADS